MSSSIHTQPSPFVPPISQGHGRGRIQHHPWLRISIHRESQFVPERILLRRCGEQRRPSRLGDHARQRRGSWTVLQHGSVHGELLSRRCQWKTSSNFTLHQIPSPSHLHLPNRGPHPPTPTHNPFRLMAYLSATVNGRFHRLHDPNRFA